MLSNGRSLVRRLTADMIFAAIVLGIALSQGMAADLPEKNRRPTVWVWDCNTAPHWRETMRMSDLQLARETAVRFNTRYNAGGRFYAATTGDVPQYEIDDRLNPAVTAAAPVKRPQPTEKESKLLGAGGRVDLLTPARQSLGVLLPGQGGVLVYEIRNGGSGDLTLRLKERSCAGLIVQIDGREFPPAGLSAAADRPQPFPAVAIQSTAESPESQPSDVDAADKRSGPVDVQEFAPALVPSIEQAPSEQTAVQEGDESHVIPPGHGSRIELTLTSADAAGPIEQRVTFSTSDPDCPALELVMGGEVGQAIQLSCQIVSVDGLRTDEAVRISIRVTSPSLDDLAIREVTCSNSSFAVRADRLSYGLLRSEKLKSGFDVHVDIPAGQPAGMLDSHLTILTNSPEKPMLRIPIRGTIVLNPCSAPEVAGREPSVARLLPIDVDSRQ